jgi:hypothetical protein
LRVLFDRNVPDQIRRHLIGHTVSTTAEQGWNRLTNGELLDAAQNEKFEVMISADQNLAYQQNLESRTLALVVLGTNRLSLLETGAERIVQAVNVATVGSYQFVEFKLPMKPKPGPRGSSI